MKNYHEIANNVLEQRDKFETKQKNRRRFLAKTVTPLCCFCLVALLGIGIWQNGLFENKPTQITNDPTSSGEANCLNESSKKDKIVINKISSFSTDRLKPDYEARPEDFVKMDKTELNDYYGVAIFPSVPRDILEWNDAVYGIYRKNGGSGEVYWNQTVLNYSNQDNTRSIHVEVKKGALPILDYGFGDAEEKSMINNREVVIGYSASSGYHAIFMYQNAGFCVNAKGLTQDEFIAVLSSILNQ